MLAIPLVLIAAIAALSLIASAITAACRFFTKSDALSLAAGTLAMPVLVGVSLMQWLMTMEADDAPPGDVILGSLTALAIATPIALLASRSTIRFLDRRTSRKVR